jgi:tRNA A-37 threonylcarbamoyl transferase component Bud32
MEQKDRLRVALAGRYEVDRVIGRGCMACVYRARDRQHGRDVAVKVLRPELAAALGTERFLREIRIEAGLQHPHILPLHDSGDADGLPYYVMPFVEGETLRERIRREGPLPVADAVRIAREVADALAYAHGHGVVHRDIKPANILLSGGHAVVADFGVARAIRSAGEDVLTEAGMAVGTPEYMSPEQGSGDTRVDGRSDIYALGCVLYEMLAGDPPFTGRTPQAVMARHRHDPPPSLAVVRPTLPATLQATIETALAKVPADRYPTALEFVEALARSSGSQPTISLPTPVALVSPRRGPRRLVIAGGAAVLAVLGTWRLASHPRATADPNKVMVFPLVDRTPAPGTASTSGEDVAIMIGSGLEHTEPLRWIDGWTWMDSTQRARPRLMTAASARALALSQSARYYISGSIVQVGDSATVVLRLNDALADSLVAQGSASGPLGRVAFPQLGVRAMVGLLPALVASGRPIDPGAARALTDRRPAAVADWLQGERAYRRSQFSAALPYFRRAVADDSALVLAALRGAEAAAWLERRDESVDLLAIALRKVDLLPPKYAHFARGLSAYFAGGADSAIAELSLALRADSTWSDAWTALGEAYYHLIPSRGWTDSSADLAFRAARRADATFTPPLYHLAEIAVRRGDLVGAGAMASEFGPSSSDTTFAQALALSLECARGSNGRPVWRDAARRNVTAVISAATDLAGAAAHSGCAQAGFRAALADGGGEEGDRWNALLGLQSLLLAEGRPLEAKALLADAVAHGQMAAMGLYVVDAVAGYGMDAEAADVIKSLAAPYDSMSLQRLWYFGVWSAHRGERERLDTIVHAMRLRAAAEPGPDTVLVAAIAARAALMHADTAAAIQRLRGLRPWFTRPDLASGLWQSFASDRLLLSQLLLRRGAYDEALNIAGVLDHPQPLIYPMYLPASLAVREEAARRLGRAQLAEGYARRARVLADAGPRRSIADDVPERRLP